MQVNSQYPSGTARQRSTPLPGTSMSTESGEDRSRATVGFSTDCNAGDGSGDDSGDPDPLDYVQSRIYLYDLAKTDSPKVLVCPQGFMTRLEFDPKGRWLAAGGTGGVWLFSVGN